MAPERNYDSRRLCAALLVAATLVAAVASCGQPRVSAYSPPFPIPCAPDTLAVVEFWASESVLPVHDMVVLSDKVRQIVTEELPPDRFFVISRENMDYVVPLEERRRCKPGECLVTLARRLGVTYILGGAIQRFGSDLNVTLELYASDGRHLATQTILGRSSKELYGLLGKATRQVLENLISDEGPEMPRISSGRGDVDRSVSMAALFRREPRGPTGTGASGEARYASESNGLLCQWSRSDQRQAEGSAPWVR